MTGEELKQQIALYESADHTVHLDVKVDEDTVWLNRQQLALLFGRDIKTIGKHVGNALREELNGFSVVAKFATTASDGKTYQVEHYNLDMILSVGYRVKSKEGIYFRRWANSVLKQHLVDGYTINRKRLDALHAVVKVLSRSTEPEIAGTAEILERYLPSLVLLNDYDTGNVPIPKGDESQWVLTYEDAMLFIRSIYANHCCVCELLRSWCRKCIHLVIRCLRWGVHGLVFRVRFPVRKNNRVRDYGR